jgi:hypothetical protein
MTYDLFSLYVVFTVFWRQTMNSIEIELSGDISAETLEEVSGEPDVAIVFANGFGGERVLKLFVSLAPKALARLKSAIIKFSEADRIENIKITRDGVEIGRMRAPDIAAVKEFVCNTLDQLERMKIESDHTVDGSVLLQPQSQPRLVPRTAPPLLEAKGEEPKDQAVLKDILDQH